MKNKDNLKIGETYQINYVGYHGYDAYKGDGIYTGKSYVDNSDGVEVFGFKLAISTEEEPNWFPLDSIYIDL